MESGDKKREEEEEEANNDKLSPTLFLFFPDLKSVSASFVVIPSILLVSLTSWRGIDRCLLVCLRVFLC